MVALPDGTVTFLLTDVAGSTALWEQAAKQMAAALARHDQLFEAAVLHYGGVSIRPRGEGDSRFAVFAGALNAVAAALAVQRAFAAEPWPTPLPIRVRIGLHTGEAQVRDDDYYGTAVNRCARLRSIGHGGQTLLSGATAALVRDDLPSDVQLIDLGQRRLKDLIRPEHVFQVAAVDLPALFPPLASLDARPHNLPLQATTLLGRTAELEFVRITVLRDDVRLVTLTGPGGTGKTRLALQAAAELVDWFVDGAYFVDLAPISDPSRLPELIAGVLGLAQGSDHLLADLKAHLAGRTLVLVLDNFEQLLAGAPLVVELLAASPMLSVLVTSRAPLQLRGEHEIAVPPLSVPDVEQPLPVDALAQYSAVTLFVERAQAVQPAFSLTPENAQAVTTICARLDGLPLALELAAARIRVLTPDALVARLDRSLPLLTGGQRDLPARQRTLRDTIAWSYDLLAEPEQRAFRALSVFVGGFTLDAAEQVLADPAEGEPSRADGSVVDVLNVVTQLVERSLVRQTGQTGDAARFGMLETIREFGLEQLDAAGELADMRDRHLSWIAGRAAEVAVGTRNAALGGVLERIEAELDNARAALRWSAHSARTGTLGLQVAIDLSTNFWTMRGYHREGRVWLEQLLPFAPPHTRSRGLALVRFAYLALRQNDYAAAAPVFGDALEIWQELGERSQIAMTLRHYGVVQHHLREYAAARSMLEESLQLARDEGDILGQGISLRNLGDLHADTGEYALAASAYESSLAIARGRGDEHETAYALRGLGHLARAQGQYARASEQLRASLEWLLPLRDQRCIALSLEGLACIAARPDWPDRAARLLGASRAMQARTGAPSPPSTLADYERTVTDARNFLGVEQFEAAWAAGAAMSLDEVVALALAAPPDPDAAVGQPVGAQPAAVSVAEARRPVVPLSARELEVVSLIAQGLSNRQIAGELTLSVRTVERHIENVYNRLGISGKAGRAIVTAYALRHQLIGQPATP